MHPVLAKVDMENIMNIASDNKVATAIAIIAFGGATTWYMYQKTPATPKFVCTPFSISSHSLTHLTTKFLIRPNSPAPITTDVEFDSVTGKPKITPPGQTVHKAPDVYGELAPGGPDLEIGEEHAKQKGKDASVAERVMAALRREDEEDKRAMTVAEGRMHGFLESKKRMEEVRKTEVSAMVRDVGQWSPEAIATEDGVRVEENVWTEVEAEDDGGKAQESLLGPAPPGTYPGDD
ncbi:hypothetical protein BDU57DRAFT_537792 [Ampelomyces quisqualis]|uniref:Uncharacterized protein n=1 Tax=Ampelomyces quisqualis TaxID=50730 RepID=A0A6A5QWH2_AMPQU|nr:hypothetical protein BDU57DRAFT_537792 [Ampelomyces quisqualis]